MHCHDPRALCIICVARLTFKGVMNSPITIIDERCYYKYHVSWQCYYLLFAVHRWNSYFVWCTPIWLSLQASTCTEYMKKICMLLVKLTITRDHGPTRTPCLTPATLIVHSPCKERSEPLWLTVAKSCAVKPISTSLFSPGLIKTFT